jgi:hypothetical protein
MFRRLLPFLLVCVVAFATSAHAAGLVASRSVGTAAVLAVQPTRVADVVLFDAGFEAGLRQGMVCRITRAGADIAEVILVELRPRSGAALILTLADGQSILPGDTVSVKTLKA